MISYLFEFTTLYISVNFIYHNIKTTISFISCLVNFYQNPLIQKKNLYIMHNNIVLKYDKKRVWHGEEEVHLTSREWKILELLAKNQGKIVTKEVILEQVWDIDENFVDTHAVTFVINRLRKKIENNMTEPVYIRNVFGVGYTFGE